MRGLPILLLLIMSASASSATVYKWVDDNGVTHFSDQPNPKAQKLEITGAQTYESQPATVGAPQRAASAGNGAPPVCVIDSPGTGQVFLDTFSITGHVTLSPSGSDGGQATLRMDGMDVSALLAPSGSFTLSQVDRGDHTLTLQVADGRGSILCQAAPVSFSIRQRAAGTSSAGSTGPTAPAAPSAPRAPGVGQPH
jgi:hypothetical protein